MGLFFTIPLYLQIVLGFDAFDTGLRLLPVSAAMLLTAASGPALARRASPRTIVRAGVVAVLAASVILLTTVEPELRGGWFTVAMTVLGAGVGLIVSQIGNVVQSSVGEADRSEAGGLQFTAQNLGAALGTALIGAIVVGALGSGTGRAVISDDRLSPAVQELVAEAIDDGVDFIAADDVDAALRRAGVPELEAAAVVDTYLDAQLEGLRAAFLVIGFLALGTLAVTGRLPRRPLLERNDTG